MKTAALSSVLTGLILVRLGLPAEVAVLDRPYGLTIDAAGHLLVSCRESHSVVVMTRTGQRVRQFGADRLQNPGGLCVAPSGQIIVADSGRNQLAVFDAEGRFLTTVGGLAGPEDVAAAPNGTIYVADTGHSRIAVFDARLQTVLFSIQQSGQPPVKLGRPVGVAAAQETLAVVDAAAPRLVVMRLPGAAPDLAKATVIPLDGASPRAVAIGPGGRTYVAAEAEVRGFSADGRPLGTFLAKALRVTVSNLFQPGGLAVDPQRNVLAVDQHTGRVLVTNAELLDPAPQVHLDAKAPTTAVIEWTTPGPQPTVVAYGKTDEYGCRYDDAVSATRHRAVLKDLAPATC
jgi:DNA-binding beta-propeller fold protein YncE